MAVLSDFPDSIDAGNSLVVALPTDYPEADGWILSLAGFAGTYSISGTAVPTGSTHTFTFAPGTTANWAPATYNYRIYATKSGARELVGTGTLVVLPNFAVAQAESHARKTLRFIQARIQGRFESGLDEAQIDGQHVKFMDSAELRKWEVHHTALVAAEDRKLSGRGAIRKIRTHFTSPR